MIMKAAYERYETNQRAKIESLRKWHQPQGRTDSERKKCYTAEWDYQASAGKLWSILSEEEMKAFADRVTQSKTYKKIRVGSSYGPVSVQFMQNRSGGIGGKATYNKIWIKARCATKYLVLHELAHAAGYMNHGVGFRVALLKLVSRFMGPMEAKQLKGHFRKRKLKTQMPKVNIKTFDEWLPGYKRMEAMRAATGEKIAA